MKTDLIAVADVLASFKRLVIMFVLYDAPRNYTGLETGFKSETKKKIGSSELYRHLHMLEKHNLAFENGKIWNLTPKGIRWVRKIKDLLTQEEVKMSG